MQPRPLSARAQGKQPEVRVDVEGSSSAEVLNADIERILRERESQHRIRVLEVEESRKPFTARLVLPALPAYLISNDAPLRPAEPAANTSQAFKRDWNSLSPLSSTLEGHWEPTSDFDYLEYRLEGAIIDEVSPLSVKRLPPATDRAQMESRIINYSGVSISTFPYFESWDETGPEGTVKSYNSFIEPFIKTLTAKKPVAKPRRKSKSSKNHLSNFTGLESFIGKSVSHNMLNFLDVRTMRGIDPGRIKRDFDLLVILLREYFNFESLILHLEDSSYQHSSTISEFIDVLIEALPPISDSIDLTSNDNVQELKSNLSRIFTAVESRVAMGPASIAKFWLASQSPLLLLRPDLDFKLELEVSKLLVCNLCKKTLCQHHRQLDYNVPSVEAKLLEAPCSDDCYKLGKAAVNADWDEYDHKFLRAHCNESVTADACDVALQLDRPCSFIHAILPMDASLTIGKPRIANLNDDNSLSIPNATSMRRSASAGNDLHIGSSHGYTPCTHDGKCDSASKCNCIDSLTFCDELCGCSNDCPRRFPGCKCRKSKYATNNVKICGTAACACVQAKRQCSKRCGCDSTETKHSKRSCQQAKMVHDHRMPVVLAASAIESGTAGFGLFAVGDIEDGDYLGIYSGEEFRCRSIEGVKRDAFSLAATNHNDDTYISYWYTLDISNSVDSRNIGNTLRFINDDHENSNSNVGCTPSYYDGRHHIALFAIRDIRAGEELYLDYGPGYWPSNDFLEDEEVEDQVFEEAVKSKSKSRSEPKSKSKSKSRSKPPSNTQSRSVSEDVQPVVSREGSQFMEDMEDFLDSEQERPALVGRSWFNGLNFQ